MIDVGLTTGIRDVWQEDTLRDYTLVVEGQEFQVHKLVLTAVSKYFKALISHGFKESKMDKVEVKGFSADIVSKLLDLIYTGEEDIIGNDTLEILQCAMYLQMPKIAEFCVKKLMKKLDVQNWPELLSSMTEFAFHQEALKVKRFVQKNWDNVVENFNPEVALYETFQVLLEMWQSSEWDKFLFLKNWIYVKSEDRVSQVNDLMSRVRFCLISAEELQTITEMYVFSNTEGPWQDLVHSALTYHRLPIHQKVLDKSEQSRVDAAPGPAFFTPTPRPHNRTNFYALHKENQWKKHEQNNPLILADSTRAICIEVNNFLVLCATANQEQKWWIFNPRTLTWSGMASMKQPKVDFAMVHHNDHLYIIGGQYLPKVVTIEMERYSFRTDKWTSFDELPTPLLFPAACVLGDTVYVSGGTIQKRGPAKREPSCVFRSLDLSYPIRELPWERKAPSLFKCSRHEMFVVRRQNEDALLVIDQDLQMQSYSPSKDQWTKLVNKKISYLYEADWIDDGIILAKGNTIILVNVSTPIWADDDSDYGDCIDRYNGTWSMEIPEKGRKITELNTEGIQPVQDLTFSSIFGAMLAVPPQ